MIEINKYKDEVLRYLKYRGKNLDPEISRLIDEVILETGGLVDFKVLVKEVDFQVEARGVRIKNTRLYLKGEKIREHLLGSDKGYLILATLGLNIHRKINYYSYIDLTRSVIMDFAANVILEARLDEVCENLGGELRPRFSPGYYDLDLEIQRELVDFLEGDKIGVYVNAQSILIPRKSVTAIVARGKSESQSACRACEKYNCEYRR